MPTWNVSLVRKELVADRTYVFHFKKPEDFAYAAGQFVEMSVPQSSRGDLRGFTRELSLASAPHESVVTIAVRETDSAFKKTLLDLREGNIVRIDGPYGTFVVPQKKSPLVFIAGGIGITLCYSMIKDAVHRKLPHKIFLFYINRRPEDAAFLNEIEDLEKKNSGDVTVVPIMTRSGEWKGERGYVSLQMIKKYLPDISEATFYVSGPMRMNIGVQKMLNMGGVADERIKSEEFTGY